MTARPRAQEDLTRSMGLPITTRTEPPYVAVKMSNHQEMYSHVLRPLTPSQAFNEKNIITPNVMWK